MWLSKEERRLIEGYAAKIGRPGNTQQFKLGAITLFIMVSRPSKITEQIPTYFESEDATEGRESINKDPAEQVHEYIDNLARIEVAHTLLMERGLISFERHEQDLNVVRITLTVTGYDLGRKYATFFSRSGEWFEEYRNHWMFLFVGFFGGVLGALLIDVLKNLVESNQ
jgi:hypothetical protein